MFVCMEAPLKIYALLASVSCTKVTTSWVKSRLLAYIKFQTYTVQIHPPLIFLLFPVD